MRPRHPAPAGRGGQLRRPRCTLVTQFLAAALLVAFATVSTSYRMHVAMRGEQVGTGTGEGVAADAGGALAGLRRWFSRSPGAARRSLREGTSLGQNGDGIAYGTQIYDHWWLLGVDLAALQQEGLGQQHSSAVVLSPLQPLLNLRNLRHPAIRLYNLKSAAWVPHNLTQFPEEVPMARWAVASLLNKAKKKESAIFLIGGYMTPAEAAAAHPPYLLQSTRTSAPGVGSMPHTKSGSGSMRSCPLASASAYSINPGRNKVRALPQLPTPCYGCTAVVSGARLHVFGGWTTPDRATRLALPVPGHWSIGLNADGSTASEWQHESSLPTALLGKHLTALALSQEVNGEPAIFVWISSSDAASALEHICYDKVAHRVDNSSSSRQKRTQKRTQMWSYAGSTGWQQRGYLPQPLSDDMQCAVASSSHELLAIGAVEHSGLFSWQRGVWHFSAHNGATWRRAGWAPVAFEGHICALHDGRLFVSRALPKMPGLHESQPLVEVLQDREDHEEPQPQEQQQRVESHQ